MIEIRHVSTGQAQRAYDDLYEERSLQHLDGYYRWLISLLQPQPGESLLDIACGEGALVQWAQRLGLEASGVDFADVALQKARLQAPDSRFVVADGHRIPFPAHAFDTITSIGSLEHYEDPEQGVREITRLLKPSGRACILLPNAFGLLWNIYYVWKTGDVHDDGQPIQRYATTLYWRRMIESNGLTVQRILPYQRAFPGSFRDWLWYLRRPHKLLTVWISRFLIPLNLAATLVYVCRPTPGINTT